MRADINFDKQVKCKDSGTPQSYWFTRDDKTEHQIRQIFESAETALVHQPNLWESAVIIFGQFGTPYLVTITI